LGLPEQPAASQFDRSERHFECFFISPGGILLGTNLQWFISRSRSLSAAQRAGKGESP